MPGMHQQEASTTAQPAQEPNDLRKNLVEASKITKLKELSKIEKPKLDIFFNNSPSRLNDISFLMATKPIKSVKSEAIT